jgi:hypothetical protein
MPSSNALPSTLKRSITPLQQPGWSENRRTIVCATWQSAGVAATRARAVLLVRSAPQRSDEESAE